MSACDIHGPAVKCVQSFLLKVNQTHCFVFIKLKVKTYSSRDNNEIKNALPPSLVFRTLFSSCSCLVWLGGCVGCEYVADMAFINQDTLNLEV